MKKIIFTLISLSFAAAMIVGVHNYPVNKKTSLLMQNVEALATKPINIWCSTNFVSAGGDNGWSGVNCAFCYWDLYGIHSGSGFCEMHI